MQNRLTQDVFRRLQSTEDFQKDNPNVFRTPNQLRYLLNNRTANGLAESGAIVIVGTRFLIDPPRFYDWLDSKQGPLRKSA